MIEYILLGFLNYGPMTGYDIKQALDSSTAHFWHAHHSQIYTTLRGMEKEGLVSSTYIQESGQPDRRIYTITESGQKTLREWLSQPMTEMSAVKEEFLVRLFFSGQRDPQSVTAELLLQRELHQRKLAVYQNMTHTMLAQGRECTPGHKRETEFWHMTLDMGMRYEQMYLVWIDDTLNKLKEM